VLERDVHRILVERLVSRKVRREIGEESLRKTSPLRNNTRAGAEQLASQFLDRPINRIFRQQRRVATVKSSSPPEPQIPLADAGARSFARSIRNIASVSATEPLPSALLTRITDHVIEEIDHQITAGRERRGKI
jgi:hypothetical protein